MSGTTRELPVQQQQPVLSEERPASRDTERQAVRLRDRSPAVRSRRSSRQRRGRSARFRSRDEDGSARIADDIGDGRRTENKRGARSDSRRGRTPASRAPAPGESSAAGVLGAGLTLLPPVTQSPVPENVIFPAPAPVATVRQFTAEQVWLAHLDRSQAGRGQRLPHSATATNSSLPVFNPSTAVAMSVCSYLPQSEFSAPVSLHSTIFEGLNDIPSYNSPVSGGSSTINTLQCFSSPIVTCSSVFTGPSLPLPNFSQSIPTPISSTIPITPLLHTQFSAQPPILDKGSSTPEFLLKESYACSPSPLGYHLPVSVKDKIVNGEFVDILSLLPSMKEAVRKSDGKGEEERRRSIPRTLNNWIQGFSIFSAILCEKKPHLSVGLFQHLESVLEAYRSLGGMAWFSYDEMYRQKMAVFPHMRWGDKDVLLWLSLIQYQRQPQPKPYQSQPTQSFQQMRKGVCFAFNEAQCKWLTNCRFKHEFSFCGGTHPLFSLFQKK